jgi:hypothetical protein
MTDTSDGLLTALYAKRDSLRMHLVAIEDVIVACRKALGLPDEAAPAKSQPSERRTSASISEQILNALAGGPKSPGALADAVGIARPNIRYHTDRLAIEGRIVLTGMSSKRRPRRRCARRTTTRRSGG